ncbi:hybrid signal transduction histidine kinase L [Condylostylus longicornis]|uniref:hybrid signal transduction histidine kinase L n=1 Tax=Condylostylus longicornis TaxID=2530218 RepID=UPI00244DC6FA|nr:hybrid signal transduction histidine kinase L [Condylostylus longicornis]
MDLTVPPELEELISCSCCHLPFNDTDAVPKLFSCRHYFCLKCVNSILLKGNELYCVHCWKRTELPGPDMKSDNLPTHNAILYLSQNLSMLNTSSSSTTSLTLSSKSKPPDKSGSNSNGSTGGAASSIISNTTNQTSATSTSGSGVACGNSITNTNTSLSSSNTTTNVVSSATIAVVNSNKIKKGENCLTHAMPNTLWCTKCVTMICRACATSEDHRSHSVKSSNEAKENIHNDIANEILLMQKTLNEVQHLVLKQRDFLLKILESCTALKTQIETELINHLPTLEIADMRESLGKAKLCLDMIETQSPLDALKLYTTLNIEKQRLQTKFQEMYLQCKLDDLIRNYDMLFNFELIKQALTALHTNGDAYNAAISNGVGHNNPILLLANYCISQLYSRHVLSNKHQQLLSNSNNNNYHAHAHQLLHQQQQMHHHQQQQHQQQNQSQTQGPPHHDNLVTTVKTYADITTSSPKSNHIHHPHNQSSTQLHSANSSNSSIVGTIGAPPSAVNRQSPSSQQAQQTQQQTASYIATELNGLTVPALTIMQHHLHQQQQQQQQQHNSNQLQKSSQQQQQPTTTAAVVAAAAAAAAAANNLLCNPSVHVYPIYYFNIEMNGQPCGRILIEVRNDVAPKMAKNFGALTTGELGFGYKGCQIFQCWENESIITGDFELNNGRGGRSVFEDSFFMPDDTKILAIRGSVGMRRSQKRHDNLGLVGSQFRIILREMRGFTGIFAFVVEGLDLVEKISQAGDSAGKPQSTVVIVNCGKYQI